MYFHKILVNNYNLFYIGGIPKNPLLMNTHMNNIWRNIEELSRFYELLVIGLLLVIELLVKLFFETWDNFPYKTLPIWVLKKKKKKTIVSCLKSISFCRTDNTEKAMAPHSSTLAWKIHGQRSLVGCSPWGR